MTGSIPDPRLEAAVSERGFNHMPAIPSEYGGEVRAYESSAASAPHIWLRITCPVDLNDPTGPSKEAVAHLTAESATVLFRQLAGLVANHYQLRDDEEAPDPRGEALRRELQFDKTTVQLILECVDAADEASGVRRVTAQELDSLQREARQAALREAADEVHIEARWQTEQRQTAPTKPLRRIYVIERLAMLEEILLNRASGIAAADSPVGGVS